MNENIKRKIILSIIAFGACILIFSGYRIIYMAGISEYAKEFTAGCIGAVITIFATAALLRSQTESEITKEQVSGIFKEKLTLYSQFITYLNEINNDGHLTHDEIKGLIEWGGKLSLICRPTLIKSIYEYAFQVIAFEAPTFEDLAPKHKETWRKWIISQYEGMEKEFMDEEICSFMFSSPARIISILRDDISHKKMTDMDENMDMQVIMDALLTLHSATAISFKGDGEFEITKTYQQKPRSRKSKNNEQDVEK